MPVLHGTKPKRTDKAKARVLGSNQSDFPDIEDEVNSATNLITALVAFQPNNVFKELAKNYFEAIPQDGKAFLHNLLTLLEWAEGEVSIRGEATE